MYSIFFFWGYEYFLLLFCILLRYLLEKEMGQNPSVQMTHDAIAGEMFLHDCQLTQRIVSKAYDCCVEPFEKFNGKPRGLNNTERTCVEEYTMLYANFVRSSFTQFTGLYEKHQRDLLEKMRMEMTATQDIKKMKGDS